MTDLTNWIVVLLMVVLTDFGWLLKLHHPDPIDTRSYFTSWIVGRDIIKILIIA